MRGVVGVLVLAACGGHDVPRMPSPPTVAILDPGAEPRVQLRYAPQLHVQENVELTVKSKVTTTVTNTVLETGTQISDLPSLKFRARFEATNIGPTGDIAVSYDIYDVTVLDDVLDQAVRRRVENEAPKLIGLRATWRLSALGDIGELAIDAPRLSKSSMTLRGARAALEEPPVRFPEGEVGIGARWKVSRHDVVSGVAWDRTDTVRLVNLTDAAATIEVGRDETAPAQAMAVEPNATTKLTGGHGSSRTRLVIPRHGLVATGSGQATSEIRLSVVRKSLRITSTLLTETSTLITAAPQPAPEPESDASIHPVDH